MTDAMHAGGDVWPARELPGAPEVVVRVRIRRDSQIRKALEHDQRVVRPATQGLSASEQRHQRRIVRRTDLDRSPRQVVKGFVLASIRCREGQLTAVAPLRAAAVSRWLVHGDEQNKQCDDQTSISIS